MNDLTMPNVPDHVWNGAQAALEVARHARHQQADRFPEYGLNEYALRAMLSAAYRAGLHDQIVKRQITEPERQLITIAGGLVALWRSERPGPQPSWDGIPIEELAMAWDLFAITAGALALHNPPAGEPARPRPYYRCGGSQPRNLYHVTDQHPGGDFIGTFTNEAYADPVLAALNGNPQLLPAGRFWIGGSHLEDLYHGHDRVAVFFTPAYARQVVSTFTWGGLPMPPEDVQLLWALKVDCPICHTPARVWCENPDPNATTNIGFVHPERRNASAESLIASIQARPEGDAR